MTADRAASVLARLLNRSRSTGENYNLLLSRFVIERLLFRLSVSPHAGNFAHRTGQRRTPTFSASARTMPTRCGRRSPPSAPSTPTTVFDTTPRA